MSSQKRSVESQDKPRNVSGTGFGKSSGGRSFASTTQVLKANRYLLNLTDSLFQGRGGRGQDISGGRGRVPGRSNNYNKDKLDATRSYKVNHC